MDYAKLLEATKEPLGLAGVALFFVFGVLVKKKNMPHWWPAASMCLGAMALIGGLFLSYSSIKQNAIEKKEQSNIEPKSTSLEATGDGAIVNTGTLSISGSHTVIIEKNNSTSSK